MPVYELRCADGHRFEVLQPFSADLPPCTCGADTDKVPSAFGMAGSAQLPPPASHMPQTWRGTRGGGAHGHDHGVTATAPSDDTPA